MVAPQTDSHYLGGENMKRGLFNEINVDKNNQKFTVYFF